MSLNSYLDRLENTILSRGDVTIDDLSIARTRRGAIFEVEVQFHDGSRFFALEELKMRRQQSLMRIVFSFHYQQADGALIFRYENSPHYPDLSTFPSHEHIGDEVVAAGPPGLADMLRDTAAIIYPKTEEDD